MLINDLKYILAEYLELIVQTQTELSKVTVVPRYDSKPRPSKPFIDFAQIGTIAKIGRQVIVPITDTEPRRIVETYRASYDIHQVGGDGEYLQMIIQMVNHPTMLEFESSNCIAIIPTGNIVPSPVYIDDVRWENESATELVVTFTHVLRDPISTYIETVEIINNI